MAKQPSLDKLFAAYLDDEAWEDFVFDLIKVEHPKAEQIKAPDGGADAIVELANDAARTWQQKFYTQPLTAAHWRHCRESLDRAVSEHKAIHVTFVFPRDLTSKERQKFRRELLDRHENVTVDRWRLSDLRDRFDKNDRIRRRYFGEGPQDATDAALRAVKGAKPLLGGGDLIDRAFDEAAFAASMDPHFRYEILHGELPLSELPASDALFMKVEVERTDGLGARLVAWRRDGHEPKVPQWWYTQDAEGERARRETRRRLARGEPVELSDGYVIHVPEAPTALVEAMERLEEAGRPAKASITLQPGPAIALELVVRCGKRKTRRHLVLYRVPPERGGNAALAGYDEEGVFMAYLEFTFTEDEVKLNLSPLLDFGPSAAKNRRAVIFMRSFLQADDALVRGPKFLPKNGFGLVPRSQETREYQERLDRLESVFRDLAYVEERLGIELAIPGPLSVEEAAVIHTAAAVLRNEGGEGSFTEATIDAPRDEAPQRAAHLMSRPLVRHPIPLSLFGRDLILGIAEFRLPAMRVLPIESMVVLPEPLSPVVHLRAFAVGDSSIRFRLVPAGEGPPSGGLWLPSGVSLRSAELGKQAA